MADNVDITAGAGTTIAADDIAGVKHQRVKVEYGADGSATDVSSTTPMPVVIRNSSGTEVDFTTTSPVNTSGTAAAVDGSTTITTGGTAQTLFTPTYGFEVSNPDATNDLWVSDSTTAAANGTGSYRVAANGGTYTTPVGYKPIGAVSIVGAVTGQKITARRW